MQHSVISISFLIIPFLLSFYYTHLLLKALRYRNIFSIINFRSAHKYPVPNLGGLVFYAILMLSMSISYQFDHNGYGLLLMPSVTAITIIGFKDDLIGIRAWKKFIGQAFSILITLVIIQFSFKELNFAIDFSRDFIFSIGIKIFILLLMLFFINAFNFIDGIDGLAGMYALFCFSVFSILSYLMNDWSLMVLSFTVIGIIIGFLLFNLSEKRKIFMGDTGSLILGLLIASVSLILFILKDPLKMPLEHTTKILVLILILIYPVYDAIRTVCFRLLNGHEFYAPDQTHIHHIIIKHKRWSHMKTSLIINGVNLFIFISVLTVEQCINLLSAFGVLFCFYLVISIVLYKIQRQALPN
jgi:UDP-N-acetylmuramyl pentapeptide phosphotransferase/UDP-N-acetylglucosamine-1-phosphate transferase